MFFPLPVLVYFAVFRCETTQFQNQLKLVKGLLLGLCQAHNLVIKLDFMMPVIFKGQVFPNESASSSNACSQITMNSQIESVS